MSEVPLFLQVCPHDHPPFLDICRFYESVAAACGWHARTVMFGARTPAGAPEFHYIDASEFPSWAASRLSGGRPALTLCHRYRAWRIVARSGLSLDPVAVVAHEFGFFSRWQRRLQRRWDAALGRSEPTFAAVSDPVADEVARALGWPEARVARLPNGIDLRRADAARLTRERAQHLLGLNADAFNIGVVGRLHPKKAPEIALAGFRLVVDRMPDARLIFLGGGALEAELKRQVAGLPVRFVGFVPDAARVMAGFDLLLLPSGDREAFGMVALEAMAAGTPVLCGSAPGPTYVIGETGRRFLPHSAEALGAALERAYHDHRSGALRESASAGRARVERHFSVPAAADRLRDLASARAPAEVPGGA